MASNRLATVAFAALVAATIAAFFVTQHLKVTTPLIQGYPRPVPGVINPLHGVDCGGRNSGSTTIRYAVAHPERVSALVLINTHAYYVREDGYPWGMPADMLQQFAARVAEMRGTGDTMDAIAPSKSGDERFRAWWARGERLGLAPDRLAMVMISSFGRDVRPLLRDLIVPTLVLHRASDRFIRVGAGRYLG